MTYQSKCLKLRRCVIAIIAANRLRKLSTGLVASQLDDADIDLYLKTVSVRASTDNQTVATLHKSNLQNLLKSTLASSEYSGKLTAVYP